ncbi:DNA-binding protein [Streptomyces sp. YU58]|uniref:DNA-binding protein n=1 Tax=Streptomyces sp. SX92 TaxID=3158972 RepID=UPI0027B9B72C|nr:DNA-binding protein [Streptomyces coralus]WLW52518.1 DNA-binding protein [Streptomyces coralus]
MPGGVLLDSEGLSKLYRKDRGVVALVEAARREGIRVGTTVMTVLEADDERVHPARINWVLSRIDVHDITRALMGEAAALLREHRLRGHKYAIDAVLAALARTSAAPVTLVTSDPEDLTLLCGPGVEVIKV